jgi:hypothetical protein
MPGEADNKVENPPQLCLRAQCCPNTKAAYIDKLLKLPTQTGAPPKIECYCWNRQACLVSIVRYTLNKEADAASTGGPSERAKNRA